MISNFKILRPSLWPISHFWQSVICSFSFKQISPH